MTSGKVKIVYHANCTDGFMAACISKLYLESLSTDFTLNWNDNRRVDVELIETAPNKSPHIEDISESEIYIFDVSIPVEDFLSWSKLAKKVELYDHHISAMKKYQGIKNTYFDMEESGASLAAKKWLKMYSNINGKISDIYKRDGGKIVPTLPWYISYVKDRDLWKFELPDSREVSSYINSIPKTIYDFESKIIFKELSDILPTAKTIYEYEQNMIKNIVSNKSDLIWKTKSGETYTVPCVNSNVYQSEIGNILAKDAPFAVVWYHSADNLSSKVKISLRSVGDFDVSVIAEELGGGGHKNASGCSLAFTLFNGYLLDVSKLF